MAITATLRSIVPVWQEIDGCCQPCHSWPEIDDRTVPAMAVMILLLVLAVLAAGALLGTVDTVRRDGYGPRPDRADRFVDSHRLF
jgi:hypothetical protein